MDPDATFNEILDLMGNGKFDDAIDLMDNLRDWLNRGGRAPTLSADQRFTYRHTTSWYVNVIDYDDEYDDIGAAFAAYRIVYSSDDDISHPSLYKSVSDEIRRAEWRQLGRFVRRLVGSAS